MHDPSASAASAGETATARRLGRAGLSALIAAGVLVMNGALLLRAGDEWNRVVIAIAALGLVGALVAGGTARPLFRAGASRVLLGLVSALLLYGAARGLALLPPVAAGCRYLISWRDGHSAAFLAATVLVAVAGEEIFWRAAVLRCLLERVRPPAAITLASALFAVAHAASGIWLLPFAALGMGFVWNSLYAATGDLTASFVSHLLWDLLVVVVAPPGG
jgi:membrane protease YdiL (CAAX protease family)